MLSSRQARSASVARPRGRLAWRSAGSPGDASAADDRGPATPSASTPPRPPPAPYVKLDLLAINDFHGQLETLDPWSSSSGRINNTPAGGAAYLAALLREERAKSRAAGATPITVAAGDLIGALPLLSAAFHDEPTIEAMNKMGLRSPRSATTSSTRAGASCGGCSRAAASRTATARTAPNSCPGGKLRGRRLPATSAPTSSGRTRPTRRADRVPRRQGHGGAGREGRLHRHDPGGHRHHLSPRPASRRSTSPTRSRPPTRSCPSSRSAASSRSSCCSTRACAHRRDRLQRLHRRHRRRRCEIAENLKPADRRGRQRAHPPALQLRGRGPEGQPAAADQRLVARPDGHQAALPHRPGAPATSCARRRSRENMIVENGAGQPARRRTSST